MYARALNMDCGEVAAAINQFYVTGRGHWVRRHGRKLGMRGGAGPGHYGVRIPGFACQVLQTWATGKRSRRMTLGMNVRCASGSERFGFPWATS